MDVSLITEFITKTAQAAIKREAAAKKYLADILTGASGGDLASAMSDVLRAQGIAAPWHYALQAADHIGDTIEGARAAHEVFMRHLLDHGLNNGSSCAITNAEERANHEGHRRFVKDVTPLLKSLA